MCWGEAARKLLKLSENGADKIITSEVSWAGTKIRLPGTKCVQGLGYSEHQTHNTCQ